jgi:two-component system chemotaxis sensor kinase CheA
MIELDELVHDFLIESCENLDRIDRDLVVLEKTPDDLSIVAGVFRSIHSIKGACGFLGFTRLESVSHVGENLLSKLRTGELSVTEEITSSLLSLVDAVRSMLGDIEKTGKDGSNEYTELVAELSRLQALESAHQAQETCEARASIQPRVTENAVSEPTVVASPVSSATSVPAVPTIAAPAAAEVVKTESPVEPTKAVSASTAGGESKAPSAADNNIRVDVGLLDKLMNLVGELVLARNQILQVSATLENPTLIATTQRLNLITTELQEGVMKTRMQPIGNIWSKLPRVVRDLALSCSKQVRVEMEGAETELDKTIIEAIKDPLTHIVRNSVDHGIEAPEVRIARGKTAEGRLSLRAYHESGQVILEINDDGNGIDGKRVKAKAVERGLLSQEQADKLPDREAIYLIFLPGFSTAEKITNVSGRGVGMDVVKTNIERIGGLVDIQSNLGFGSTIRIRIPLTLAIIPALMVSCEGNRFAIPQVSLLELLRVEPQDTSTKIEWVNGTPVIRLRGNLLPLVSLGQELNLCSQEKAFQSGINVVVLQADDRHFGLVIDEIQDTGEIVVKPLSKRLKAIPVYAGATILGDGQVALILDVMQLAQRANIVSESRNANTSDVETSSDVDPHSAKTQSLLVFESSDGQACAVQLSSLTRLEEVERANLETSGGQTVIQYRDQIMPLIDMSMALGGCSIANSDDEPTTQVLVYGSEGRAIGLMVHRISDIVHEELKIISSSTRPGIAYTAVVQGRVTEIIDVCQLIQNYAPEFSENACSLTARDLPVVPDVNEYLEQLLPTETVQ